MVAVCRPITLKLARGESNMADSSFCQETIECIQEESETPPTEPNLKDIHNILKSIQGAISVMQGTIATLVKENTGQTDWRCSRPSAHYRKVKNNSEVEKFKRDFTKQNQYVASLELDLKKGETAAKQQRSDIQELQESLDQPEQYSRKNSIEIHGIPKDIAL